MMLRFIKLLRVLYITLPEPYIKSAGYHNKASTNYLFEETMTGAKQYTQIRTLRPAVFPKVLYMVGFNIKYGFFQSSLRGRCFKMICHATEGSNTGIHLAGRQPSLPHDGLLFNIPANDIALAYLSKTPCLQPVPSLTTPSYRRNCLQKLSTLISSCCWIFTTYLLETETEHPTSQVHYGTAKAT